MHHNLEIIPGADKPISPEQLLFNARIEKINVWKEKLNKVQLKIEAIKKRVQEEISPLKGKVNEKEFELVKRLDGGYKKFKLNKKQKNDFVEVIMELIVALKMNFHDEELNVLHDEYAKIIDNNIAENQKGLSEEEIAEGMEEANEMTKEFIKNMIFDQIGIEIDDDDLEGIDINDPNSLHRIMEKIMLRMEQEKSHQYYKGNKKSKTPSKKMKEEINNLNKTGRQIYTELIKLLHPDRSKDEEERTWKTEAIKEVTEAYEKNDFYALLQLQIKYIEKAAGDIRELTGKRLDHYNGLLLQQMKDLQQQYDFLTKHGPEASLYKNLVKSKKRFNAYVQEEKDELEMRIEDLEDDLSHLNTKNDLVSFVDYSLSGDFIDEMALEFLFGD